MASGAFGHCPELPDHVRDMFTDLCQDVASLHAKWQLYLDLFSSDDDTALLSGLARSSFQLFEEALRSDMTMAICRLSDPHESPGSRGMENLSIDTLVRRLGHTSDLDALLRQFQEECESVRRYRNKRVGHNDLNTALEPKDNPLPGIGRRRIERILQLAAQILNTVYRSVVDAELGFRPLLIGGGSDLLYWLRLAKHHHDEETRRLTGGEA